MNDIDHDTLDLDAHFVEPNGYEIYLETENHFLRPKENWT